MVMMPYKLDDEDILFARYGDLFIELRGDTGEIIPVGELNDYLSDLEEFSIYPREVLNELKKWLSEK